MVRTGSDEGERSTRVGCELTPDEAAHPTAVRQTAGAGSGEAGEVAPSVAVPAGELGRMVAREALPLGATQAAESADVHAGPMGEVGEGSDGTSVGSVTSAEVVAGLVVAREDADAAGADSAAVTVGVALSAGVGGDAVGVVGDAATLVAPPREGGGRVESGLPPKPRRISKPMLAAAAIAGVVLTAVPFALSSMGSHSNRGPSSDGAAFSSGGGPSSGFVPSAETGTPQYAGATGASQTAGVPTAGQPAGSPGASQAAAPGAAPAAAGHAATGQSAAAGGTGGGAAAPAPQPRAQPNPVTYSAVGGPGCTNSTTGYKETGSGSGSGWLTSSGAYSGDGCNGRYSSIPMSGNAQDSPYGNYAVWSFHTGTVASCAIFVYIPNNGNIQYVGGNPTNYTVHSDSNVSSGNEIGHFPIKQVDNLGQWYSAGTFPVSNGQIAVEIHDAGKDWNGNVATNAHHASAEVKATCTG